MSPLEINIILEIYAFGNPFDGDYSGENSAAAAGARQRFIREGVIKPNPERADYVLTDRGRAYVDFLLAMPLPTELKSWHMPTYDEWEGIETLREEE